MHKSKDSQKGIKFEASFGQLFASSILILVMLVLPIGGYEYLKGDLPVNSANPYTAESLQKNDTPVQGNLDGQARLSNGQVKGISTSSLQSKQTSELKNIVNYAANSTTILIIIGIVLTSIALTLSGSIVYDFMKKS